VRNPYFFFTTRRFFEHGGGLLFRLLERAVVRSVPCEVADADELRRLRENKQVVFYLSRRSSLIEQFILNVFLVRAHLPIPSHSFGPRTLAFFPLGSLFKLAAEWMRGGGPRRYGRRITGLYLPVEDQEFFVRDPGWADFMNDIAARELWVVPVTTLWNKETETVRKEEGQWLLPLVGRINLWPTFRELLLFLLGRRRLALRIGLAQRLPREKYSSRLYRRFYRTLEEEKKNVVGAALRNWLEMRSETLFALEREVTADRALVERHLDAIATRYSPYFTDRVSRLIGRLLSSLFSRIECRAEEIKGVRRLAAHPAISLVFVPSHRSYFDYLLMFHLLYREKVAVPLVVAGDNLDFFPLGGVLRRLGAFFIRRRVRDDPLYRMVFGAYLRTVVESGYHIEFFIEGGRTRSGKVRAPRTGLLSMLSEIRRRSKRRLYVVPVSITYERLHEIHAYAQEQGPGKEPERKGFLRKFFGLLRANYGPAYVAFGDPVYLPAEFDEAFAAEVAYRIERGGFLSFSGLFAAFFTTHEEIYAPALGRRMAYLAGIIEQGGRYRLAPALRHPELYVPRLVERLAKAGTLVRSRRRDHAYRLAGEARAEFFYHRNTALFALAPLFLASGALEPPAQEMARLYLEGVIQGFRVGDCVEDPVPAQTLEAWVVPFLRRSFLPLFHLLAAVLSFLLEEDMGAFGSRTELVQKIARRVASRRVPVTQDEIFDVLGYLEQRGALGHGVAFDREMGHHVAREAAAVIEELSTGGAEP